MFRADAMSIKSIVLHIIKEEENERKKVREIVSERVRKTFRK